MRIKDLLSEAEQQKLNLIQLATQQAQQARENGEYKYHLYIEMWLEDMAILGRKAWDHYFQEFYQRLSQVSNDSGFEGFMYDSEPGYYHEEDIDGRDNNLRRLCRNIVALQYKFSKQAKILAQEMRAQGFPNANAGATVNPLIYKGDTELTHDMYEVKGLARGTISEEDLINQ